MPSTVVSAPETIGAPTFRSAAATRAAASWHPQRDRVADRAQLEQAEVGERDRGEREEDGEERLPRDRRAEALVRAREHVVHRRGEGEVGLEHVQFLCALLAQFFDTSLTLLSLRSFSWKKSAPTRAAAESGDHTALPPNTKI